MGIFSFRYNEQSIHFVHSPVAGHQSLICRNVKRRNIGLTLYINSEYVINPIIFNIL